MFHHNKSSAVPSNVPIREDLHNLFRIPPPPLPPPLISEMPCIDQSRSFPNPYINAAFPPFIPPHIPPIMKDAVSPQSTQLLHSTTATNTKHFEQNMNKVNEQQLSDDERWVLTWLSKIRKEDIYLGIQKKPKKVFKISDGSEYFKKSIRLLKDLEIMQKDLSEMCESLSDVEWQAKWEQVVIKKTALSECLNILSDPQVRSGLKRALVKRGKKRAWQKRWRERRRVQREESRAKNEQLHRDMDKWLEDMQDTVERTKRDESLKAEADQVLSEVTQKKAEAKKQVALLASLQKLRELREKKKSDKGAVLSVENKVRFSKVTDRLKLMWEQQLRDYQLEEQGLRVMLEEAVEERSQQTSAREKISLMEWEHLLFGKKKSSLENNPTFQFFTVAERDLESFVSIRKQWDSFLSCDDRSDLSTGIPVGWVLPAGPSSEKWANCLET